MAWTGIDATIQRLGHAGVLTLGYPISDRGRCARSSTTARPSLLTTWDHEGQRVRLVTHRVFQPSPEGAPRFRSHDRAVHCSTCASAFCLCKVLYDPYQMHAYRTAALPSGAAARGVSAIAGQPHDHLRKTCSSSSGGKISWSIRTPGIRLAISRAVASETPRGWRISQAECSPTRSMSLSRSPWRRMQQFRVDRESYYNTNMDAWVGDDVDWQGLRTNLYVRSGGTFRLF